MRKIPLRDIVAADFKLYGNYIDFKKYHIKQQDGSLLRQIRLITGKRNRYNPYIIFVKIDKKDAEVIRHIVMDGFTINGHRYLFGERSASMTRNGILSFVDEDIYEELDRRVTMGITFDKIVLSKYSAYRGLMLSACHMLEGFFPKIIVVPDYFTTIKDQNIKYAYDDEIEFIDSEGRNRTWKQKNIGQKVADIEINAFDGCGICHPAISRRIEEIVGSSTPISSFILRGPYLKGCVSEIDYEAFYRERGITHIKDVWGVEHDFSEPMIIITEGMYKGLKFFKTYGDYRDWDLYWERFHEFNHCLGIAKWNFTAEEEPVYTRGNYQILQDLDLEYDDFRNLANDSIDWADSIINGDKIYTYCFLGMFADRHKTDDNYVKAILKNPEMMREASVRKYLTFLLTKYRNDMKAGKLWLNATFKFMVPDLIMLMEWAGGLDPRGCLEADEFYSHNLEGAILGERLIERNPHICKSEHVILTGVQNDLINTYCAHLDNICMINCKSITPQRLNGADWDGDLCFLINNQTMMKGVNRNAPVVIDIEDKITALAEEDTPENRVALVLRTINSLIGETSNAATGYHNKKPKSEEVKKKYESYVDLLSIINGKAIDYAKTGVLYNIPRHIAKYSKPLPYFMKYASDYYGKLNKFSHANSNMNRLCKDIEKWSGHYRYSQGKGFDYSIMIDTTIKVDQAIYDEIELLFDRFCKEMQQLMQDQNEIRKFGDPDMSRFDSMNFTINWQYYYEEYEIRAGEICPDQKMLANIAADLCYRKYPKKNKKFLWVVATDGLIDNIRQIEFNLPIRDEENGVYEYLGRKYSLAPIQLEEEDEQDN